MIKHTTYAVSPVTEMRGEEFNDGLTKREYFAALSLNGLRANTNYKGWITSEMVAQAVKDADALIEQLNR